MLRGVNAAGGEFGDPRTAATFDSDASFAFYASRGHKLIRIPFRWERVQPTLNGTLDATYLAALKAAVLSCTSRNMTALIDCHNYARYKQVGGTINVLGDGTLTSAHMNDLWTRLANEFKSNSLVEFGLMNEPHDIPAVTGTFSGVTVYDFESSLQGWVAENTSTTTVTHNTSPVSQIHDGVGGMEIVRGGLTNTTGQHTRVNDAGGNTRLSANGKTWRTWVRVSSTATGSWRGRIEVQNNAFAWVAGPETTLTPGTWAELEFTPTDALWAEGPNPITIQLTVDNPTVTSAGIYVDTVRHGTVAGAKTSAKVWEEAAQSMVNAVRATAATNFCRVGGYDWSSAKNFWTIHPTWWITDSQSGPEGHYYPDPTNNGVFADDGDTYASVTTYAQGQGYASAEARAAAEVGAFVDGCVSRSVKGLVGETGWPNTNSQWNTVGEAIYDRLDGGGIDATYWAAGEQWGTTYELSIYTGTPQATSTSVAATVEAHPAGSGAMATYTFDTDLEGWTGYSTNTSLTRSTTTPDSGAGCALATRPSTAGNCAAKSPNITVSAGTELAVSVRARPEAARDLQVYVEWRDSVTGLLAQSSGSYYGTPAINTYTTVSFSTGPAPTGATIARIIVNGLSYGVNERLRFDNVTYTAGTANQPPTANAGADQSVSTGATVTLTGSGTDPDGTIASYAWTLPIRPSGSAATLSGTGASRTFTADVAGTYTASLTVTDNGGAVSQADTVNITATTVTSNAGPVVFLRNPEGTGWRKMKLQRRNTAGTGWEWSTAVAPTPTTITTNSISVTPTTGDTATSYAGTASITSNQTVTLSHLVIGTRLVGQDHTSPTTGDFTTYTNVTLTAGVAYTIPSSSRTFTTTGNLYAYVAWSINNAWNRDTTTTAAFSVASPTIVRRNATNTGIAGKGLTLANLTAGASQAKLTTAGATYTRVHFPDRVYIGADNITFIECQIDSPNGLYTIHWDNTSAGITPKGTVFEDCTIDGKGVGGVDNGTANGSGRSAGNEPGLGFTMRRCDIFGQADILKPQGSSATRPILVEDSYIHNPVKWFYESSPGVITGTHSDVIQISSGTVSCIIRRCTLDGYRASEGGEARYASSSGCQFGSFSSTSVLDGVVFEDNYIDGGGYAFTLGHLSGLASVTNSAIRNNRFGLRHKYSGTFNGDGTLAADGTTIDISGNVWDVTGVTDGGFSVTAGQAQNT